MKILMVGLVATAVLTSVLSSARADAPECPDPQQTLHIDGYDVSGDDSITIVRVPFFGFYVSAALIRTFPPQAGTHCELRALLTPDGVIVDQMPWQYTYFCGGDGNDDIIIYDGTETSDPNCRTGYLGPIYPIVYGPGTVLSIYGGNGWDHIDGGNGMDVVYGGPGNDNLNDGHNDSYAGWVLGESGDDRLYGGPATGTYLLGGEADDVLIDLGGYSDYLYGEGGSERCLKDHGGFLGIDGGPGYDAVDHPFEGNFLITNCEVLASPGECF